MADITNHTKQDCPFEDGCIYCDPLSYEEILEEPEFCAHCGSVNMRGYHQSDCPVAKAEKNDAH